MSKVQKKSGRNSIGTSFFCDSYGKVCHFCRKNRICATTEKAKEVKSEK